MVISAYIKYIIVCYTEQNLFQNKMLTINTFKIAKRHKKVRSCYFILKLRKIKGIDKNL